MWVGQVAPYKIEVFGTSKLPRKKFFFVQNIGLSKMLSMRGVLIQAGWRYVCRTCHVYVLWVESGHSHLSLGKHNVGGVVLVFFLSCVT